MKPEKQAKKTVLKRGHALDEGLVDPLRHIFMTRFFIYIVLLTALVLWPFDIFQTNHVRWLPDSNGIEFVGDGMVLAPHHTEDLYKALTTGTGLTLEVWLATADAVQTGPARIISYSLGPILRNFTLAQFGEKLVVWLRTSRTSLNGTRPHLIVSNVFKPATPLHIVVSYDFVYQTVFVNGIQRIRKKIPGGKFTNWDPTHYFLLGNEVNSIRPWVGKLYQVGIYNRALRKSEILQNYERGWSANLPEDSQRVSEGIVAHYLFDEGQGRRIENKGSAGHSTNLHIPRYMMNLTSTYLRWPKDSTEYAITINSQDTILNVLGFIPLGFFLHGFLRNRKGLSWKLSAFVLFLGAFLSFSLESMQHFSISRDSSAVDLLTNTVGTLLGIIIDRSYIRHVRAFWAIRQQAS